MRRTCRRPSGPTALARLNPTLPAEALDDAYRKISRPEGADLNPAQPRFAPPAGQFSVAENKHSRRPDVVPFVNGLALAMVAHGLTVADGRDAN